ncbi:MAG TPA: hypothetical protein PK201_02405 [Accumulibacter sp.]|nr:hypothetical protein [Accumulibacter sp.]
MAADQASIKRSAFLVGVGGYVDCHTPFKMVANGPELDFGGGLSRPT